MPLFRCRRLTRAPWLQSVSFNLEAGQLCILMGPSGSGKSLLLRALADLDPVERGEVWLGERERNQFMPGAWRRQVLYVHQSAPRLGGTVLDNLRATDLPMEEDERSNPFGLDLAQEASQLSGGEAQLMALTRALHTAPKVYLLDEATSALDAQRARLAEEQIQGALGRGAAALWVSHDERIAERLGAEILRLEELSP